MTTGSYLFKQFQRILSEWPTETGKRPSRDFKVFLNGKVDTLFHLPPQQQQLQQNDDKAESQQQQQQHTEFGNKIVAPGVTVIECKRQLEALQQLANNQHQRDFPVPYTSGMFGYSRETIQEMNSDEGLKKLRVYVEGEKKPSRFQNWIELIRGKNS